MAAVHAMRIVFFAAAAACASSDPPRDDGGTPPIESAPTMPAPAPTPIDPEPPYDPCARRIVIVLDGGVVVSVPSPCVPYDPKTDAPDPPVRSGASDP